MKRFGLRMSLALAIVCTGICMVNPALADKPAWAGGEKGKKQNHKEMHGKHDGNQGGDYRESHDRNRNDEKRPRYFSDQHRSSIHGYYADQFRRGHCPPGFSKKHNRCMPPGQARKWVVGRPLPRTVVFYDLPPSVLVELGPAPSRHRFVRVAQDILLIATGTGMVVDAIDNLNWEFSH